MTTVEARKQLDKILSRPESSPKARRMTQRECRLYLRDELGYSLPPIVMAILYQAIWLLIKEFARRLWERSRNQNG